MLVTRDTLKAYIGAIRSFDEADDALLDSAIDAAGDLINYMTGRTIELATGIPSTRTFYGTGTNEIDVDDFVSLTSITGTGVISPTTYQVERVVSGLPYYRVLSSLGWPTTTGYFPNLTVNADWGWAAIPGAVTQACLILAKDIMSNQSVSFGIAGFTEYAGIRARENPQVRMILAPYVRGPGIA